MRKNLLYCLMAVTLVRVAAGAPVVSEVKEYGGAPAIWIDGRPQTGAMHWNRGMTEADVAVFRDAGVHLFSFMGAPPIPDPSGAKTTYENRFPQLDELSEEFVDGMLGMIERTDPAAKVLLRLRLTTPDWWRAAHPDECVKAYDISKGVFVVRPWASPASEFWRTEMDRAIRRVIQHIEKKWSHLVIGYHPGLCCCAENAIDWSAAVVDYSGAMKRSFGKPLPDPARYFSRRHDDTRRFLDPKADADAVAFQRHLSRTMSDAVCFISHIVKDELRALGRTKICGAFYGYFCLPANGVSALNAAHQDFRRVLDSPDVDFIAAPLDYGARQAAGTALAQTLPGSVALHGKFYYGEEDTRFHTAPGVWSCVSGSTETSDPILRRNFLNAFAQGGAVWWMDLFAGGWYSKDRAFTLKGVGACRAFAERHLANRGSVAEIALFVSERSIAYDRAAPLLSYTELVGREFSEAACIGAPFDVYLLEDLPLLAEKGKLGQYRLALLLNASAPEQSLRKAVKKHLSAQGRTVVFAGAPGYIDGAAASAKNAADFIGIALAQADSRDSGIVEAFVDGRRISYGTTRQSTPSLAVNDDAAEPIAWYVEGSLRNTPGKSQGVAVAAKAFADHRAIVSLVNFLPSDLLRRFAQEAGVHVYSPHGDQVFAGPGWFAVSAKMSGRRTLAPRGGRPFEVDLKRGEVRVFETPPAETSAATEAWRVTAGGRPVSVVETPMPENCLPVAERHPYHYTMFTCADETEVTVAGPNVPEPMTFRLLPGSHRVIDPAGRHGALIVAANPLGRPPKPDDPGVRYFGPGRHHVETLELKSGETLYLAEGAWLEACVVGRGENITISGPGVLSGACWKHRHGPNGRGLDDFNREGRLILLSGRNITVRDVTIYSSFGWTLVLKDVDGACVDNVKILGGRVINDDGIDICSSRNVTVRNSFVRTQDDAIAPKWWCEDLVVTNCTVWSDDANNFRIGFECDPCGKGYGMRRQRYVDLDLRYPSAVIREPYQYWAHNFIHLQAVNEQRFEDIVFENIRVPHALPGDVLLNARTQKVVPEDGISAASCFSERAGTIDGVVLRNFSIAADGFRAGVERWTGRGSELRKEAFAGDSSGPAVYLEAMDDAHPIRNVRFENVPYVGPVTTRGAAEPIRGLAGALLEF